MKRINKKSLEALNKLIAKYSGGELKYKNKVMRCPLCDLFYFSSFSNHFDDRCRECHSYYF